MSEPTRQQLLRDLQASQQQVVDVLASTEKIQDWQREPVEWSFRHLAAHLVELEQRYHLRRVQRIASGDMPRLRLYNESAEDIDEQAVSESLREWIAARQELLDFVSSLDDHQLHFIGIHEQIGAMTVLDALQEMLEQDQGTFRHICQLIVDYLEEAQ